MKRQLCLLALVLLLCVSFLGCENYEQADADRITAKGTEMMQAYLAANMPDAQLAECTAYITNIPYTSLEYLFDYATGRIILEGEETVFAIDTVTGAVYFRNDQTTAEQLNALAAAFFYETMGITPEGSEDSFECYVLAPFRDENHELNAYQMNYGFDFGLPAAVEDLEAFVRDPASRPQLYVKAKITLSDETDLAAYDFAAFEEISQACGMLLSSITIENSTQTVQRSTREWVSTATFWEEGCWLRENGIYFTGNVRVRKEQRHDLTREMTVSDRRFDPQRDLVFEKTATGYRYYLPSDDWQEGFFLCAQEGAEILEHTYTQYFYSDVAAFAAGNYDPGKQEGSPLVWRQLPGGDYVLVSPKDGASEYFSHAGTLERAE